MVTLHEQQTTKRYLLLLDIVMSAYLEGLLCGVAVALPLVYALESRNKQLKRVVDLCLDLLPVTSATKPVCVLDIPLPLDFLTRDGPADQQGCGDCGGLVSGNACTHRIPTSDDLSGVIHRDADHQAPSITADDRVVLEAEASTSTSSESV